MGIEEDVQRHRDTGGKPMSRLLRIMAASFLNNSLE